MTAAIVALVVGVVLGFLAARRGAKVTVRSRGLTPDRGPGAHLLPDPALGWLLRAHGAWGVWVADFAKKDDGPRAERAIEEELTIDEVTAVDRRLERARDLEQNGAERMHRGTLVYRAAGGFAVGLLLRDAFEAPQLHEVEHDLTLLLDGVRRRPQVVALAQAQAQTHSASLESVESVGLRLAFSLERITGANVVVVARHEDEVQIVGLSGHADHRLRDGILPPDSPLARVALGELEPGRIEDDPLGGLVEDRRQQRAPVELQRITVGSDIKGAVALWLPTAEPLAPLSVAELREVLAATAPRFSRALEAHALRQTAFRDALTGLLNRRGLDRAMLRHGVSAGALIFCDLDKFKTLNDTLGHPAGDAALMHLGELIRDMVRDGDAPARIGGEEFAIWLPNQTLELGLKVAERVRSKLSNTEWMWQGTVWPLRASFGVAATPETSRRIENLAAQADAALYVAKRNGRDQVAAAGSGTQ